MDGFGAAFAAWIILQDTADYIPAHYGDTPPDVKNKIVYILDFSYPREVLQKIIDDAASVTVIDHHKTAEENLKDVEDAEIIFNLKKSGAVLAYEYFHQGKDVPMLFSYIQDRDLWIWELPDSKFISAALSVEEKDFNVFLRLIFDSSSFNNLIDKGKAIIQYESKYISKLTHFAKMANIAGYSVPCINNHHLISEVGHELAKQHAFSAQYFDTENKRVYSLRSTENGIDVSAIAVKFGGGGHKHAAGFSIPLVIDDLT